VERHVQELAAGLVARGHLVEVVTCAAPSGASVPTGASLPEGEPGAPERVGEGPIPVRRFGVLPGGLAVSPGLGAWLLANASRFDLVHAHSYHAPAALQALIAARAARRPFVLTPHYHGIGHTPLRRLLHIPYRPFGRRLVRGSRPLICVSLAERALLQRDFGDDLQVVIAPNGVEVRAIRAAAPFPAAAERRLVVVAGRLEPHKQVDRVLDALAVLPSDHDLVVLGSGSEAIGLRRRAAALRLEGRVRFLGHVPTSDLHRWLRTADVFVTLSRHEAFGIALLEGAAAGAGVVASDIPAHAESAAYAEPEAVRLVDVDASPPVIAEAIAASSRRELSDSSAVRFPTWDLTIDRTLEAYERALAAAAVPPRPRVE
jgi:glycosyltransferase involved in cell wall biosynthesis